MKILVSAVVAVSSICLPLAAKATAYSAYCKGQMVSINSTSGNPAADFAKYFGAGKCSSIAVDTGVTKAPTSTTATKVTTPTTPTSTTATKVTTPKVTPTTPAKVVTPVDPYKNLYTVQGWQNAYKTSGVGIASTSPYYAAAVNKQTIYDANGNFLQAKNLGTTTKIGTTTYIQSGSAVVNGVTVYTYVKK